MLHQSIRRVLGFGLTWAALAGVATAAEPPAVAPLLTGSTANGYRIDVVRIGDVRELMTEMELVVDPLAAAAPAPGAAVAMGGGVAFPATMAVALKVYPPEKAGRPLFRLAPACSAIDEQGRKLEGKDHGALRSRYRRFETAAGGGDHFLYLRGDGPGDAHLTELQGAILVTPGDMHVAEFEGNDPQEKKVDGMTFALQGVGPPADGGDANVVRATVGGKLPKGAGIAETRRNPGLMLSMYSADLVDDAGVVHGQKSSGGGVPGQYLELSFTFEPLPAGRTVKKVRIRATVPSGKTRKIPFKLTTTTS